MKIKKPVIIVLGEPNSVFVEILVKVISKLSIKNKLNYPIILIGSKRLILSQLKILKKKIKYKDLENSSNNLTSLENIIYLINVNLNFKNPFEKISYRSQNYITECFNIGINFMNKGLSKIFINGPISKKHFLKNKFPGMTEYIFSKSVKKKNKQPVMLIFNKKFSVSPVTTHLPLKDVSKNINKGIIENNILRIDEFYKEIFKIKPRIALLGLNPHCESKYTSSEESKIIKPIINKMKKRKIYVDGPFSADTFFLKDNFSKFKSVIGMYHDQVLTPFKTIFGFDASNITLGLPFLRISVDHGPNENMLGKNKSNTKSLENIFNFINLIK